MKQVGEFVMTIYGWGGLIKSVHATKTGKIWYIITDEENANHRISHDSVI